MMVQITQMVDICADQQTQRDQSTWPRKTEERLSVVQPDKGRKYPTQTLKKLLKFPTLLIVQTMSSINPPAIENADLKQNHSNQLPVEYPPTFGQTVSIQPPEKDEYMPSPAQTKASNYKYLRKWRNGGIYTTKYLTSCSITLLDGVYVQGIGMATLVTDKKQRFFRTL
jgi:hypothetical protein